MYIVVIINNEMKDKRKNDANHKASDHSSSADYYFDNGLMVMTEQYHMHRGYCCGSKCRHCPYEHKNVSSDLK